MSFKEFYVTCNPPLLLDGVDEVVSHVQGCFQEGIVLEILYEPDIPWFKVIADESYQTQVTKAIATRVQEFFAEDPEALVGEDNTLGDLTRGKKFCSWDAYKADFRCETEWKQYWSYMVPETMRDARCVRLWRGIETCGAKTFDNLFKKMSLVFKSPRMPRDFASFQRLLGRDIEVGHNMRQDLVYFASSTSQREIEELLVKLDAIAFAYNRKSFRQDQLVQIGHVVIANTKQKPMLSFQPLAYHGLTQRTFVQPEVFGKRDIQHEYNTLMRSYTVRSVRDGDELIKSEGLLELQKHESSDAGTTVTPFTEYQFTARQPAIIESRRSRSNIMNNLMIKKWRSRVSDVDERASSEYAVDEPLSALLPIKRPFTDSEKSTSNMDSVDPSIKGEEIDEDVNLSQYEIKKEESEVSLLLSFDAIQGGELSLDHGNQAKSVVASPTKEDVQSYSLLDGLIGDEMPAKEPTSSTDYTEEDKENDPKEKEKPLTRLVNLYLRQFSPILKVISGRVKFEVQLGRICLNQIPAAFLQGNETSLPAMLHNLTIKMNAPNHFQFMPVLSTSVGDINKIVTANMEGQPAWQFVSLRTSYNFVVKSNGEVPNSFAVEVDAESYDYQCREAWSDLLSLYLHHGKSNWDARVYAANSPVRDSDWEDDLAVRLAGSLKAEPVTTDGSVALEIMDLHGRYDATVDTVEVRQVARYQSSTNSNIQLNVSFHRLLEKSRGLIRPKASPFAGMTTSWKFPSVACKNGSPKVWVEATISHKVMDKILEENTDLEFGQTTGWDVERFCTEGYFSAMCQAASMLISQMDLVGITNDNGHAQRLERDRRQLPKPNLEVRK